MRFLYIVSASLLLFGCSVHTARYYVPQSSGASVKLYPATGCNEPSAATFFKLGNDNSLSLSEINVGNAVAFEVRVYLRSNQNTFQFESNSVRIESTEFASPLDTTLSEFLLSGYGIPKKNFSPTSELKGPIPNLRIPNTPPGYEIAQYVYESRINFSGIRPAHFVLRLPNAIVDGKKIDFSSVEFRDRNESFVYSCLK